MVPASNAAMNTRARCGVYKGNTHAQNETENPKINLGGGVCVCLPRLALLGGAYNQHIVNAAQRLVSVAIKKQHMLHKTGSCFKAKR